MEKTIEDLEQQLRQQAEEIKSLKNIINSIPGHIYWKNVDGVYQGQNYYLKASSKQDFQLNPTLGDGSVGKTDFDIFPAETAGIYRNNDLTVIKTGKIHSFEEPVLFKNGVRTTQLSMKGPLYDEHGAIIGTIGNTIDVTYLVELTNRLLIEKQRAEFAKLTVEHRIQTIIDSIAGNHWWKDRNGHYLGCSTQMAQELGLTSPSEIIGKTDDDLSWSKTADYSRKNDDEVMLRDEKQTFEEVVTDKSGDTLYFIVNKAPLKDDQGNIIGIMGSSVDVTYMKRLQKSLQEAEEKATQSDKLKTEFIRNMEHDIRTPFSGIWGMANYLVEQETDSTKKEYLNDIAQCAKELLDFCNDILDFSRIEAKELPVEDKLFDLKELFDRLMRMEQPPAKMKDLVLNGIFDEKLPTTICGDRYRLYRILINLTSNAVKFTEKGSVTVRFLLESQGENHKVVIRFIIEDTGIGIPEEKQQFVYEKFTRINPAPKGHYKGFGLGLPVVKQFIQEMGGKIAVESTVGKGSKFTCTIPFSVSLLDNEACS